MASQVILVSQDFRVSLDVAVRKVIKAMMDLLESQAPRGNQVGKVSVAHQGDKASQDLRVTAV